MTSAQAGNAARLRNVRWPAEQGPDPTRGASEPRKSVTPAYLSHQQWLAQQKRREEREKARAEGRWVPPSNWDDEEESAPLGNFICTTFMFGIMAVVFALLSGLFLHNDPLWGYRGKWSNWRTYVPRVFTPEHLLEYNGEVEDRPVLLAIKGDVFDVSAGRIHYSIGSPYHFFAGRDASRAYVTGCFSTHLTHDVRGFGDKELKALDGWHHFYATHPKYHKVGTVRLPAIDPTSPIPAPCQGSREQKPDMVN